MAYSNNQNQQGNNPIPFWMANKAKQRKANVAQEMEQAKMRIPKEYHDFLVLLPQSEKIGSGDFATPKGELSELGLYCSKGHVYLSIEKPYVTVDGRLQMLRDEHQAANKTFQVQPPEIIFVAERPLMSVRIDSEIYGSATGMIEIGLGGKGADSSNPFANAQTSAIGRALGFLGYGLIGTGLSDLDENPYEEPIQQQPKQISNAAPNNGSDNPLIKAEHHRLQIVGNPTINQDGSATVSAKTEAQHIVNLVLPKTQVEFSKSLFPNAIINIVGTLNNTRLVVAEQSQSKIENAG